MIGFYESLLLIWKKQTNFWNKNDMKTLITNGLNYWKYSVVLDNLEI